MTGVKREEMLNVDPGDSPVMIKLKSPNRTRGIVPKGLILILILTVLMFLPIVDGVGASAIAKNAIQKGAEINSSSKGVVAINTHKSIYLPNENAFIGFAVLDRRGLVVCNADVTLIITDPNNKEKILTTANGDVVVSDQCTYYGATDLPDYYANYKVGEVGTYQMNLTAVTQEGVQSIGGHFSVQADADFDVARDGPTRINPEVPYIMGLTIKANKDYDGPIVEYVPASFEIIPQEGLRIDAVGGAKVLTWNKKVSKGETRHLYYEFDAPDISPYLFGLGPLEIGDWEEERQWQIASDATLLTVEDTTGHNCDTGGNPADLNDDDGAWETQCDKGDVLPMVMSDISGCQDTDTVSDVKVWFHARVESGFSSNGFEVYISDDAGEDTGTIYCLATYTPATTPSSTWITFDCEDNPSVGGLDTVGEINSAYVHFDNEDGGGADYFEVDYTNMTVTHACTAVPNPDVINFTIYESSSTSFGTGSLICSLTDVDDGTSDTCATRLEASKDYRVEIQVNNSGTADGALNNVTWGDISNLLSGGGEVNVSACTYSDNTYAGGESNATTCSYSAGEVKFDNATEPTVEQDTYIWVSIVFTTGSSPSDATTMINPYIGNYNDTSDQITVKGLPVLLPGILESTGLGGYGWRQVYNKTPDYATGQATRFTGSVDREYYDWGFKEIQISGRKEDYWSRDSGWWYVSGEGSLNFKLNDSRNDTIYTIDSVSTTKGRATVTYNWNSNDDPGEWIAYVDDGENIYVSFKLYVRGQLNVTNITINPANPNTTTQVVNITANITDHAGNLINWSYKDNNGTDITPNVTAYVTGAGEDLVLNMSDDDGDGIWNTSNFQLTAMGDHLIIISSSDGHEYWVDGRGNKWVSVGGTFPYASPTLLIKSRIFGFLRGKSGFLPLLASLVLLLALLASLVVLIWPIYDRVRWGR